MGFIERVDGCVQLKKRPLIACLLLAAACSPADSDLPPPAPAAKPCDSRPEKPDGLVVAGSGPVLPIARLIAREYEKRHPGERVVIPGSIGSAGAVAALKDGAIDIGLLSRPLRDSERSPGIIEKPFARVPLSAVVRSDTPVSALGRRQLVDIFRGVADKWPEGTPITPLVRERGDSGNLLFATSFPELAAAIDESLRTRRWTVCYSDGEMRDALLEIRGAIGFLDATTIAIEKVPLKTVSIEGAAPEPAGGHPFERTYFLLARDLPQSPAATAFVELALSAGVRAMLAEYGVAVPTAGNGER
ncbi:MAG: substrate-binding domain-containing protein [Deltaproteobacteria bacterium]|nr:substrate-binding domain-containing protein [Deltaproteobacteria bacterium]